jgi:hypothetical protein
MRPLAKSLLAVVVSMMVAVPTVVASDLCPPAVQAGPPGSPPDPVASAVSAVVVKSWWGGPLIWQHLNDNWDLYGSVPVVIDHTTLIDVETVTLEALESVAADVVIVSDPAGGLQQWTEAEVTALQTYVERGHNLVGTFLLLYWDLDGAGDPVDNRLLAPLWGLRSDLGYSQGGDPWLPSMPILDPCSWLFVSIVDPFEIGGYRRHQVPSCGSWHESNLSGALFVARAEDGSAVVTNFYAGAYRAAYISFMPEYQGGEDVDAAQWVYNAIVCQQGASSIGQTTWGRIKAAFQE